MALGVEKSIFSHVRPFNQNDTENKATKATDNYYLLLNCEIFTTLSEAKIIIEQWRREYNHVRPHSALRYRPPAPEAIMPAPIPITLTQKVVQLLGAGQEG